MTPQAAAGASASAPGGNGVVLDNQTVPPPGKNTRDMWTCPYCGNQVKSEAWRRHLSAHVRYCGYPGCPSTTGFKSPQKVAQGGSAHSSDYLNVTAARIDAALRAERGWVAHEQLQTNVYQHQNKFAIGSKKDEEHWVGWTLLPWGYSIRESILTTHESQSP
ncbi:hypothetical protein F5Y13DRAFT_184690 [Hypoxylon sp. FL1857]|nr:hypothetical protein F5Y13DRAFT_184690 [Hypoxylon sp. FL1857]